MYHGNRIHNQQELFWYNNIPYIDIHQYDGFRHNINNLDTCQRILDDRITNPYYVFFFYPSNIEIGGRTFDTSEYQRYFHSSHPTRETAIRTINRDVETIREGTLEFERIYFVIYFGDEDDSTFVYKDSAKLQDAFLSPMPYNSL